MLELALVSWAMNRLVAKGFTPVLPPDLVRSSVSAGCGFQPREDPAVKDSQVYQVGFTEVACARLERSPLLSWHLCVAMPNGSWFDTLSRSSSQTLVYACFCAGATG